MRTKFVLAGLCLVLAFASCKKEESKPDAPADAETEKVATFDVVVDLVIPTDEELIIYYKDGSNEWFVEEKAVWRVVKGGTNVQQVVFNLPENVLPNDIRFDIGRNEYKGLKSLQIKKVAFHYYGKNIEIPGDQIMTFFRPNEYIVYDKAANQFTFKKDDKGNYDPYFESKPELYPKLAEAAL